MFYSIGPISVSIKGVAYHLKKACERLSERVQALVSRIMACIKKQPTPRNEIGWHFPNTLLSHQWQPHRISQAFQACIHRVRDLPDEELCIIRVVDPTTHKAHYETHTISEAEKRYAFLGLFCEDGHAPIYVGRA